MEPNDQNKPKTVSDPSANEIDEFAQKLLNKKAELALFPDDDFTSSSLEGTMSEAQRKTAETSMLSALDQLRKERGQTTIEEEERRFVLSHPNSKKSVSKAASADSAKVHNKNKAASNPSQTSKKPSQAPVLTEPNRYETSTREDHFEPQEKKPSRAALLWHSRKFWAALGICGVIAALFGAYAWKVTIYDPAHVSDAEQDSSYKKLINFADEYSMKSDAQKKEIINLEADYNSLPEARKKEINEYFQNPKHTGKTFVELLNEARQGQAAASQQNANYGPLSEYAQQYAQMDESDQLDIVNRIGAFNSLDDGQKAQINSILQDSTGKDFMTLYNEAKVESEQVSDPPLVPSASDPVSSPQDPSVAAMQQELTQLYNDRSDYLEFLNEEGESGEGDDILAEYNAQIEQLENQLGV